MENSHREDAENGIKQIHADRQPQGNGGQTADGDLSERDGQERKHIAENEIQAGERGSLEALQKRAFSVLSDQGGGKERHK